MKSFPREVSHHESTVKEFRADRQLAIEYFSLALEALGKKDEAAGGMLALERLQEAYGGLGGLAKEMRQGVPVLETAAEYLNWRLQKTDIFSIQ